MLPSPGQHSRSFRRLVQRESSQIIRLSFEEFKFRIFKISVVFRGVSSVD